MDGILLSSKSSLTALIPESVENKFQGVVKELIYLGDHIRIRLAVCKNEDFIVKIPNEGDVNFKEEDKVKLSWLAKDIRALDLANTNN